VNVARILDQARFFEGISRQSKEALSKLCMPSECPKHTVLFARGNPEKRCIFWREAGCPCINSPRWHEVVIKVIKPGEVFAEAILFEKKFYPVTAIALTDILAFKLLRRDPLGPAAAGGLPE